MRQLDIMAHMKKTATTYEIILKKVEHFRAAVKARSEEEAVELAMEKERKGESEYYSGSDVTCVSVHIL